MFENLVFSVIGSLLTLFIVTFSPFVLGLRKKVIYYKVKSYSFGDEQFSIVALWNPSFSEIKEIEVSSARNIGDEINYNINHIIGDVEKTTLQSSSDLPVKSLGKRSALIYTLQKKVNIIYSSKKTFQIREFSKSDIFLNHFPMAIFLASTFLLYLSIDIVKEDATLGRWFAIAGIVGVFYAIVQVLLIAFFHRMPKEIKDCWVNGE